MATKRSYKERIAKLRADAQYAKSKGEEWLHKAGALAERAERMQREADEAAGTRPGDA